MKKLNLESLRLSATSVLSVRERRQVLGGNDRYPCEGGKCDDGYRCSLKCNTCYDPNFRYPDDFIQSCIN